VSEAPALTDVFPSVLVIARSAELVIVVVSVAESFKAVGSVVPAGTASYAVFERVPLADEATVPVTVNVALLPEGRFTAEVEMSPSPDAGQLAPGSALQVQLAPVKAAGKVSDTVAPVTAEGPLFVTTIV
jgi:hypothetical protein